MAEETTRVKSSPFKRDDRNEVALTLARLRQRTGNQPAKTRIKTGGDLPRTQEITTKIKRRYLIILLASLVAIILSAILVITFTNQEFTPNNATVTVQTIGNSEELVNLLNRNQATDTYIIFDQTTTQNTRLETRELLTTFGLVTEPLLAETSISTPALLYRQRETETNQFVIAFMVNDYPNAISALRKWETSSRPVNSPWLSPINTTNEPFDLTLQGIDYRVINDSLAYTITIDNLVLIGTNPEIITEAHQTIINLVARN